MPACHLQATACASASACLYVRVPSLDAAICPAATQGSSVCELMCGSGKDLGKWTLPHNACGRIYDVTAFKDAILHNIYHKAILTQRSSIHQKVHLQCIYFLVS